MIGWLTVLTLAMLVMSWLILRAVQQPQYQTGQAYSEELTPTLIPGTETVTIDLGYLDGSTQVAGETIQVPILIQNTTESISAFAIQLEFRGAVPTAVNIEPENSLNQQMRADGWSFPVLHYEDGVLQLAGIYLSPEGYVFEGGSEMSTVYMISFVIPEPSQGTVRLDMQQSKVMSKVTSQNLLDQQNKTVWSYEVVDASQITPSPSPTTSVTPTGSVTPSISITPTTTPGTGTPTAAPTAEPTPTVSANVRISMKGIPDATGLRTAVHVLIYEADNLYPNDPVFSEPVVIQGIDNSNQWRLSQPIGNLGVGVDYHIYMTSNKHLMRDLGEFSVSEDGQVVDLTEKPLLAGDTNGDNLLTIEDIGAILSVYDELVLVNDEALIYDFNFDNKLSLEDLAIVLTNYTDLRVPGDAQELHYLLSQEVELSNGQGGVEWPELQFLQDQLRGWSRGN